MSKRAPNLNQYWHCTTCKEETEHKVEALYKSRHRRTGGVRVYERMPVCQTCHIPTTTIELDAGELRRLLEDRERLSACRSSLNTLEAAVRELRDRIGT